MNGVLNILKPPGMTSHDVVAFVRRTLGIKKVGHTGTLDPGAAGVLPICIGKSTKIVEYLMDDKKIYICEVTFGNKTDTYDKYGNLLYENDKDCSKLNYNSLQKVITEFKGKINQKPPIYSAVKINGVRAYDLARRGETVDIKERTVEIFNIEIIKVDSPKAMLKIECSKGTYIRSLCNDIGEKLGCGAYMSFLIRTATGKFSLANSHTLEEISQQMSDTFIVEPDFALEMQSVYIDDVYTSKLLNGNSIVYKDNGVLKNTLVKIYIKPDRFIGIGRINNGILSVEKLLV
ncbi:hypothetical protein Q428_09125 [Fervidicella metallireducens AeB]|uniref:tRNA pseudouridine synthase B n=1 Tax=Fervidicella metallireducens AeB TaxID=1403537 RepID=A0A017RU32_9CLOT|nr:tRNA pseudouridine(55) synthase TruB [Fervidicella metallireducens]EYE88182.1 hypothetical protein Q428_09125 [Fervidicella metallireducens AeB]